MLQIVDRFDRWLALPLGALATLGFQPFGLWPLSIAAVAGLFALCEGKSPLRSVQIGWLFGFAHFASGVYWVVVSTHVYGGAPLWLGLLLAFVLFAYLAIWPALVCALASWLRVWRGAWGWVVVPALWLLAELLRGWVMTGFPWLSLGYIAPDMPLERWAPLLGVHGISVLVVASAYGVHRFVGGMRRERAVAIVLALLPWSGLLLPDPASWSRPTGETLRVAIVQGNVPQDQKWDFGRGEEILARYREMTLSVAGDDLVAWPEVVPNAPLDQMGTYFDELGAPLARSGTTLLAGVLIRGDGPQIFNSMIALGAASGRYDKRHLVPFGEYFPIPDWLRPLMDVLGTPYSDFSSGAQAYAPIAAAGVPLGISICFEDVFGAEFARESRHAQVLVNATNDAWFAGTSAPHQHLAIARMRALENGRWLVRATNTGISALIGPDGTVPGRTQLDRTVVLRGEIGAREGLTPYARWRDLPLWILAFGVTLLGVWRRPRASATAH